MKDRIYETTRIKQRSKNIEQESQDKDSNNEKKKLNDLHFLEKMDHLARPNKQSNEGSIRNYLTNVTSLEAVPNDISAATVAVLECDKHY